MQRERRVPALIEPCDVDAYLAGDENAIHIPFIGYRTPRGYRRVGEPLFVDSSGFGSESEPAWTRQHFLTHIKALGPSYWGTVEFGKFQVYVQQYTVA